MRVYCGDLNIHIGELIDFLLNDDLDRYKECVDHVDNPIISNRRSMNNSPMWIFKSPQYTLINNQQHRHFK
jgi:hypothetical protein